jgi:hypothetical protein
VNFTGTSSVLHRLGPRSSPVNFTEFPLFHVIINSFATSVLKQLVGNDHFVPLPRRERDVDGATFGVDDDVELC